MTKFLTAMTIIGLIAFKTYANFGDLQDLATAITQFRQVITEMDAMYVKGEFKKGVKEIVALNTRVTETLKYCPKIEASFAQKAPDVLEKKQAARDNLVNRQVSLLDSTLSDELKAAQITFVTNLEGARYCLGLTSQLHTAIRASISGQIQ